MINNVVLTGRLTKDIELKYINNNVAATSFSLAVNRSYGGSNGEKITDFISCVAFRKTAELMANYLKKGSLIGVSGRIQTRNYQGKDGRTVYVTEVVAENLTFLESKKQDSSNNDFDFSGFYDNNVNNNQFDLSDSGFGNVKNPFMD